MSMNKSEKELKRFVWAYMLEAGRETSGIWNFYGSDWMLPNGRDPYDYQKHKRYNEDLLHIVRTVGVDWDKTQSPESDNKDQFNGTFGESSMVETLLGTLCLKDGTEVLVGVSGAESRFKNYVETLRSLLADEKRVTDMFGET